MSSCTQKSNPDLFPTGVLGAIYPARTKFDLAVMAKSNTASTADYIGPNFPNTFNGIREEYNQDYYRTPFDLRQIAKYDKPTADFLNKYPSTFDGMKEQFRNRR